MNWNKVDFWLTWYVVVSNLLESAKIDLLLLFSHNYLYVGGRALQGHGSNWTWNQRHTARHALLHMAPKWSSHRTTRAGPFRTLLSELKQSILLTYLVCCRLQSVGECWNRLLPGRQNVGRPLCDVKPSSCEAIDGQTKTVRDKKALTECKPTSANALSNCVHFCTARQTDAYLTASFPEKAA